MLDEKAVKLFAEFTCSVMVCSCAYDESLGFIKAEDFLAR
jgi:hypothetical protein